MFAYKMDVLKELKAVGYNTTRLRSEKLLSEGSIQALREGKPVGIIALDKICGLLKKQPGSIIKYIPDDERTE